MATQQLYEIYKAGHNVQTDTRKLAPGEIFFALSGPNFNGNEFAASAIQKGASCAVIDDPTYAAGSQFIIVEDVLLALQDLARHHIQRLGIPVLAITGSNGKTTTKELIHAVLKKKYQTSATIGNLNNHIGIPLTILAIPMGTELSIIEMGANHQGEIAAYCQIALPHYGLITNCGKAHIEGFGGIEGVRKGKGELYDYIRKTNGCIFRNADLDYLNEMAKGIGTQVTYGQTVGASYRGEPVTDSVLLQTNITGHNDPISTQLVGAYNFPNVLAAVAVGLHFGIAYSEIKAAIEDYAPDNSRSQWLQVKTNNIILDAYNANPTSMQAAINNFAGLHLDNKMLWIGGMKEMGGDERKEHEALVSLIESYSWEDVILVGREFEGLSGPFKWFPDSEMAASYVGSKIPVTSNILIKGSRGSKMEKMLAALG